MYVRRLSTDEDVVELCSDEVEHDDVQSLMERLTAWKEHVELALKTGVILHRTGDDWYHVITSASVT